MECLNEQTPQMVPHQRLLHEFFVEGGESVLRLILEDSESLQSNVNLQTVGVRILSTVDVREATSDD
jgi:hypothetical protein